MPKLLLIIVIAFILLSACDPISGDAGAYAEPTRNVGGETMSSELEQVERARETREAGR